MPPRSRGKVRPISNLSGRNSPTVSSLSTNGSHNAEVGKHLMKTKICSLYLSGKCHYGASRCFYAHSVEELREAPQLVKTSLCSDFKRVGKCLLGDECKYAHSVAEMTQSAKKVLCLWHSNGNCSHGSSCRFSHEDNSPPTPSPMSRYNSLEEAGRASSILSTMTPSTPVIYRRGVSSDSNLSSVTHQSSILELLVSHSSDPSSIFRRACLVCGGDSASNCICRVFEECSELLRLL